MFTKALLCVSLAQAARLKTSSQRSLGQIDFLYTTGAPAVADKPLTNAASADGCFAGTRYFTKSGGAVDLVPMLAYIGRFVHPMTDAMQLHVPGEAPEKYSCSSSLAKVPDGFRGDMNLHMPPAYIEAGEKVNEGLRDEMIRLSWLSSNQNVVETKEVLAHYGWNVAGHAFDQGAAVGGPQISYLWQHAKTLECMVTFQGSLSLADWFANINLRKVEFCGIADNKVHDGFKTHLLMMVKNADWQANILSKLGKCSKVHSVGMSLGAAKASLFAACVNNAPSSGVGYEDEYRYMSWRKEDPALLPPV